MIEKNIIICANCNEEFTPDYSDWSEEQAMEESRILFGEVPKDQLACICDDCFKEFKPWYDALDTLSEKEQQKEK